ncbi:HAD-IIA family hydrolase [Arsenicitalea aurantiaca]|uniref:HAD-IIA family hydrolase n=1 Tax=Arsenicitalea aurantiaca TaxID=1783274 RepID=UPI0013158DD3|nr:HAD family hydrolase [Arsenicitalea aurantiaca]
MSALLSGAAGFLIDLDGTLVSGRTVLPDAHWLLQEVGERFVLVSNNSEHTPEQLSRHLRQIGLQIPPERMVLAGTTALGHIAKGQPGARVLLLGSPALRAHARQIGLELVEDHADVVLVTRDRRFTYQRLAQAARAVASGARLVVACPDRNHPGPRGQPVPEAGALGLAVAAAGGAERYEIIGKPEPLLFELGCARLGIAPSDGLMIGDNAETDGAGALRLGMGFLQVRKGLIRTALARPAPAPHQEAAIA